MINLSLYELVLIVISRGIKNYKKKSKDGLMKMLSEPESKLKISVFSNDYIEYKSKGDKDKTLSIKEYLYMIRPYLSDTINDHKIKENGKFIQAIQSLIIKLKENVKFS